MEMELDKDDVETVIDGYELGSLKSFEELRSGHHSDNYYLETDSGEYVLRVLYEEEKDINYILEIYDKLVDKGIETAKPIPSSLNEVYGKYKDNFICLQEFIPGEPRTEDNDLFTFYGEYLGKIHSALSELEVTGREDLQSLRILDRLEEDQLPEDEYLESQYSALEWEINQLPLEELTEQLINSDLGPEDFRFKEGEFQGVLDFGDTHPDYLLYDLATTMMYCDIYGEEDKENYLEFIESYLDEFSLPEEELKHLKTFLKIRFVIQATYHEERRREEETQGASSQKDNLEGIEDAKRMLKKLEEVPPTFYHEVLK